ncbi:MAG: Trk system potassium transporter TrkA [Methanomassiliicoccus sp.]|nr:Trk system potassium transporter TrkA [Methanomassiliicoccus sp.]
MRIIIVGAGTVGYSIARILSSKHVVIVVERDEKRYEYVMNTLNVGVVNANGASPQVLERILKDDTDLFLAMTESDEANVFACLVAKKIRPGLRTVVRMRDRAFIEGSPVVSLLEIDQVLSPELLVATKIWKLAALENAIDIDRIPKYDLEIARFKLTRDTQGVTYIPMQHLPLSKDCRVLCVHRAGETVVLQGDATFQIGDEIVLIGSQSGIAEFDKLLGSTKKPRDILIVGGGLVAQYLIGLFEKEDVSLRLIEKDEARCKELAQRFNKVIIINDNGADPLVLRNENVGMTDVLVCATKSEESNLLACLVGKHLGVPKTITTYSKQEYKGIFQMAGIDAAISYHEVVANEIVKATVPNDCFLLLNGFEEALVSLKVNAHCRIRGDRFCQIELPERSTVAAVVFDGKAKMPNPDGYVMEGDTLLVYADKLDIIALERIFNLDIPVNP